MRVLPGRLSVSRAFGDCIVATPEIKVFPITNECDLILLGSDGVFDKLENEDIFKMIREEARSYSETMPSKV